MVAPFLLSCSVFQLARQVQLHVHGPMLNSELHYSQEKNKRKVGDVPAWGKPLKFPTGAEAETDRVSTRESSEKWSASAYVYLQWLGRTAATVCCRQKLASAACAWLTVFVLINDAKARESNADGGVDVLIIHDDGKRFETVGILRFKKGGGVVCRMAEAFNFGNDGFSKGPETVDFAESNL
uniref:Uncharacterized protein n=1 Tax=Oryza glaberrima TaxID=4538 RepID=I1NUS3_ORYGL